MTSVSPELMFLILGRFLHCRGFRAKRTCRQRIPVHAASGDHRRGDAREYKERAHQERVVLESQDYIEQTIYPCKAGAENCAPAHVFEHVAGVEADERDT